MSKFEKLTNYSFLTTKVTQFFSLIQSNSGPDHKFLKRFTVRIQSKKNSYRPDPVQSKSSSLSE